MLALAAQAATDQKVANITWVLGGDGDLPALAGLLSERTPAAACARRQTHADGHQVDGVGDGDSCCADTGFTDFCEETIDYTGHLTLDEVIGHLYSAMPRRLGRRTVA